MNVLKNYITVKNTAEVELIEKRSRFIASVKPTSTEQEALDFLAEIKKKYALANHHVFAYVIAKNNICRYSDDGEPSSTAGIPALDVIRKEGITDVCVVITRYFGGTLLGTGGLVRAYSGACRMGLYESIIINRQLCDIIKIRCDYSLLGKIEYIINTEGHMIESTDYAADVNVFVCVETPFSDGFIEKIKNATHALAVCEKVDTKYIDKKHEKQ